MTSIFETETTESKKTNFILQTYSKFKRQITSRSSSEDKSTTPPTDKQESKKQKKAKDFFRDSDNDMQYYLSNALTDPMGEMTEDIDN